MIETIYEALEALKDGETLVERGNARLGAITHYMDDRGQVITRGPHKRWNHDKQAPEIIRRTQAVRSPDEFKRGIVESLEHDDITLEVLPEDE